MNDDLKYLPEEFLNRMNNMLGDDFQAFLNSYPAALAHLAFESILPRFPVKNLKKLSPFP